MSYDFIGNRGGRTPCWHFFEDMMLCTKKEGAHRTLYKCRAEREDYSECLHHDKKHAKLRAIKEQKEKLIKEGKWPLN